MISARTSLCLFFCATTAWTALGSPKMSQQEMAAAVQLDTLTVPSPGEFFVAIDKIAQPPWQHICGSITVPSTDSRERMALILGILVADGFVAVESQDGQAVKNTGKEIISLAKKLGVSQSVLARGNSLNDFAESNDWGTLREELEATQNEVKLAMAERKDQELVTLVSVGAWLRGLQVASRYIAENDSAELAALLRQPAIADYLLALVAACPPKALEKPLVQDMRTRLQTIRTAMATAPSERLPAAAVQTLHTEATAAIDTILQPEAKP